MNGNRQIAMRNPVGNDIGIRRLTAQLIDDALGNEIRRNDTEQDRHRTKKEHQCDGAIVGGVCLIECLCTLLIFIRDQTIELIPPFALDRTIIRAQHFIGFV